MVLVPSLLSTALHLLYPYCTGLSSAALSARRLVEVVRMPETCADEKGGSPPARAPSHRSRRVFVAGLIAMLLAAGVFAVARIGISSTRHQTATLPRDPVADAVASRFHYVYGAAGTDTVTGSTYVLTETHDNRAFEGDAVQVTVTITSLSPELQKAIAETAPHDPSTTFFGLGVDGRNQFAVTPQEERQLPLQAGASGVFILSSSGIGTKIALLQARVLLNGVDILKPTSHEDSPLSVEFRSRPVFLGLSEAQLRALQTFGSFVGIPGLLAALVGWFLGRRQTKPARSAKRA
jgi:hypothetical protein